tara:strand:+ start:143 stop:547 length:405 start_codon:yes stop_codon:yes gene_type:complete
MVKIEDKNGKTLARYICKSSLQEQSLGFFSDDREQIQLGAWNYSQGKSLARHYHNTVPREFEVTGEVLIVMSGSILATIYDDNQFEVVQQNVHSGDVLILLSGGHGYEILENNTHVLEVKNGPYLGADIDRTRF